MALIQNDIVAWKKTDAGHKKLLIKHYMKKIIVLHAIIASLALTPVKLIAQSVGINTDGSIPNTSALLDVKSTAKGFLMPRMTTVQRNAIVAPASGLLVFDTDFNSFWYYGGTSWISLNTGWSLSGNSSTNPATHFIGTTDSVPLNIRVNNEISGQINIVPNSNTSWGYQALKNNTTGNKSMAIGYNALVNNTTGIENTALGYSALSGNTTGIYNTGVGNLALSGNTTGVNNTAVGNAALISNSTGSRNTAVGMYALLHNTDASRKCGIRIRSTGEQYYRKL